MSSPSPLLDMWHNNLAGDPMLSKSDVKSACTDSSVQRIWRILSTRTVGPLCVGPTPISQSVLFAGPEVIVFDEPQAPGCGISQVAAVGTVAARCAEILVAIELLASASKSMSSP